MAGEMRLKDARIEVKLDTAAALRQIDDLEKGAGGRSVPGGRPPSPGRRDEAKEREDDERKGRRRREVAERPGIPGMGIVKAVIGASALQLVSEMLPAMIDAKLATMASTDVFRKAVLEALKATVGKAAGGVGSAMRAVESAAPVIGAFTGTAVDVARSASLMFGGAADADIATLAKRQAAIASAEVSMERARRAAGRAGIGAAIVNEADALKAALFGGSAVTK